MSYSYVTTTALNSAIVQLDQKINALQKTLYDFIHLQNQNNDQYEADISRLYHDSAREYTNIYTAINARATQAQITQIWSKFTELQSAEKVQWEEIGKRAVGVDVEKQFTDVWTKLGQEPPATDGGGGVTTGLAGFGIGTIAMLGLGVFLLMKMKR